jgi:aminoglycoside phosphotransferase (APT) family kinase protein
VTDPALAERLGRCLGQKIAAWRPVTGGYSPARRWLIRCADGSSAFVKVATDALTARWLRAESVVYAGVRAPFMAAVRAWDDDGSAPMLVLEDLSGGVWQAPWTPERVGRVLATLRQVAAATAPAALPSLETRRRILSGWAVVARAPAAFLGLKLCSSAWLSRAVGALAAAEAEARLAGDDLVHLDVRSDNLCFLGERVVLVDWNWACRGNGAVDVAAWLPSLHLEGGPPPDAVLPGEPCLAAAISGYFASQAGRPPRTADETRIRALQLAQLRVALPWAVRALPLPALDAPDAA